MDRLFPLHTKLILVGALVAIVVVTGWFLIADMKSKAFAAGREACQTEAAAALAKANAENREREVELETSISDYAAQIERLSAERRAAEARIVTRIEERLVAQENCSIDPAIIALRNEARAAQ